MHAIQREALSRGALEALRAAEAAVDKAYCPHSGLSVAACLVRSQGTGACGVNYESDSYGLTLCAERAAIARAQADGTLPETTALVLAAKALPEVPVPLPLLPCGACRQWISELSRRLGRNLEVISFGYGEENGIVASALDLLPADFTMSEPRETSTEI